MHFGTETNGLKLARVVWSSSGFNSGTSVQVSSFLILLLIEALITII